MAPLSAPEVVVRKKVVAVASVTVTLKNLAKICSTVVVRSALMATSTIRGRVALTPRIAKKIVVQSINAQVRSKQAVAAT